MRLIHRGQGNVLFHDEAAFVDTTVAAPRVRQRLKRVGNFNQRNPDMVGVVTNGNGYKPGPLGDLAHDQCRFHIGEKTMCGAKTIRGRHSASWCDAHYKIVYPRVKQ